jgi:hypothetical protein
MKKIILTLSLLITITACKTEQEKLLEKQIATCKEDIFINGKEPTPFCMNILPSEDRLKIQPTAQYQQPQYPQNFNQQQYQQSTPVQQYQNSPPVIINQQPASSGVGTALAGAAVGAIVGATASSLLDGKNNTIPQNTQNSYQQTQQYKPMNTGNFDSKFTPPVVAAPKINYMDTSRIPPVKPMTAPFPKSASSNRFDTSKFNIKKK